MKIPAELRIERTQVEKAYLIETSQKNRELIKRTEVITPLVVVPIPRKEISKAKKEHFE